MVATKKKWSNSVTWRPGWSEFSIVFNDHDDGYVKKDFETEAECNAEWDLLLSTAPHTFASLTKLGFQYD